MGYAAACTTAFLVASMGYILQRAGKGRCLRGNLKNNPRTSTGGRLSVSTSYKGRPKTPKTPALRTFFQLAFFFRILGLDKRREKTPQGIF
jgi:hypothetical protein